MYAYRVSDGCEGNVSQVRHVPKERHESAETHVNKLP